MSEGETKQAEPAPKEEAPPKSEIDQWFDDLQSFYDFVCGPELADIKALPWLEPAKDILKLAEAPQVVARPLEQILRCRNCDRRHLQLDTHMRSLQQALSAQQKQLEWTIAQPQRNPHDVANALLACIEAGRSIPHANYILPLLQARMSIAAIAERYDVTRVRQVVDDAMSVTNTIRAAMKADVQSMLDDVVEARNDALRARDVAKSAADSAARATGIVAANAHAARHEQNAKDASTFAAFWVFAIAIVGIGLTGFVLGYRVDDIDLRSNNAAVFVHVLRLFSGKLAVISMGAYLLAFCVRNYRAQRHNAVLNEHRAAVFSSYEAFHDAAKDEKAKELILSQTLQLVLAAQPTGYLPGEQEQPSMTTTADVVANLAKMLEKK